MIAALLGSNILRFLTGPAGRIVLLGLAFAGWTIYQRVDATRSCESAQLQEELIEAQRQLGLAQKIAEDARAKADQTEREMTEIERLNDALQTDLAARPATAACIINDTDRERLLGIK